MAQGPFGCQVALKGDRAFVPLFPEVAPCPNLPRVLGDQNEMSVQIAIAVIHS